MTQNDTKAVIICPFFNAEKNLKNLTSSIKSQSYENFECFLIDDVSTDNSYNVCKEIIKNDKRFNLIKNNEKQYALKNIITCARNFQNQNNVWIGVVDGDDMLIDKCGFKIINNAYKKGNDVVYTDNVWDVNNINSSKPLPPEGWRNPYDDEWRYSHFRTFRASLLSKIKDENFYDPDGKFVVRGYDQFLMLPMVYLSKGRIKHINKTCYKYNLNSVSIPLNKRNFNEKEQLRNIKFLRGRGFIK